MKLKARILTVILTLTLIISCCVIPAQADIMPYKYGDVNMSENVDIMDVTEIQNHLAQIESIEPYLYEAADVDADAKITIYDATTVQRYLAGIIDKFQSGEYFFTDMWLYHVYPDFSSGRAITGETVTFTADGYANLKPYSFRLYVNDELVDENTQGNTLCYTFYEAGTYSVKVGVYDKWGVGGGFYTSWSDKEYVVIDKPEDLAKPHIAGIYREDIFSRNVEIFTNVQYGTAPYQYKYTLVIQDEVKLETEYSDINVFRFNDTFGNPVKGYTVTVDVKDANGNTDSYSYNFYLMDKPVV